MRDRERGSLPREYRKNLCGECVGPQRFFDVLTADWFVLSVADGVLSGVMPPAAYFCR